MAASFISNQACNVAYGPWRTRLSGVVVSVIGGVAAAPDAASSPYSPSTRRVCSIRISSGRYYKAMPSPRRFPPP
jgi:hypothetical protein